MEMTPNDQELQKIAMDVAVHMRGNDCISDSEAILDALTQVRDAQEEIIEKLRSDNTELFFKIKKQEEDLIKAEEGYQCYKRNTTTERERLNEKLKTAIACLIWVKEMTHDTDVFNETEQCLEKIGGGE
jgi:aromatic ring hydroxylase